MTRQVCFVMHVSRTGVPPIARRIAERLQSAAIEVSAAGDIPAGDEALFVPFDPERVELALVLGGDGTMLRAAEHMRDFAVPLLGLNLGKVGFLAEMEADEVDAVVTAIVDRTWHVERRRVLNVHLVQADGSKWSSWALNEVAIEKAHSAHMVELGVFIDDRPVMAWGGDGIICATPTGSTAYAFSAGGPVVWPDVDAHLVVPVSAHALFARPLVTSPLARIDVVLADDAWDAAVSCDGRRNTVAKAGARISIVDDDQPVLFARLQNTSFTDRLVAKFQLPVTGWRKRDGA